MLVDANVYYDKWKNKKIVVHGEGIIIPRFKGTSRYIKYGIPPPASSEVLIKYIERLRKLVSKKTYSKKAWEESLGIFLEFIRANTAPECHGFIEVIFPEERAFYSDAIIRLVRLEKYPTNILVAGAILKHLSDEVLWGDLRTQYSTAEALAFAWLCLTSSRLQIPTRIQDLYNFDGASLTIDDRSERQLFQKRYLLKVPTLFGGIPMEISERMYNYLSVLFEEGQKIGKRKGFLQSTDRCLRELFSKAVSKLNLLPQHGEVTFTTFTSWPDENLHHRTQIDNKKYQSKAKKGKRSFL